MVRFFRARRSLIFCCHLLWMAALPAGALHQVSAEIVPLQPQLGRNFTVVLEGMAASGVAELVDARLNDEPGSPRLTIEIAEGGCAGPCMPGPFRLEVPIDGSLPFQEQTLYLLEVLNAYPARPEDEFLSGSYFALGRLYSHAMRPAVALHPRQPSDNDSVQLLIASEPNVCGPSPPEVAHVDRLGNSVRVFLDYYSGFGPIAAGAPGGASEKCTPAVSFLDALQVGLGQLEAGDYSYEVYLREASGQTQPIRSNRGSFTVADAPDSVPLHGGRFEVAVQWTDFLGRTGDGQPVPGRSEDSTLFSFFGRDNWELLLKVLDACEIDGHYWVFSAAATTVAYAATVTDTTTGQEWRYDNPLGVQSAAVTDTTAFACQQ